MIAIAEAIDGLSAALGGGQAARLAALALIEADALDLPRFGIAMLDEWTADAAPLPTSESRQAIDWVDCSSCFAPLAVAGATLALTDTARQFGIAAIFLRGVRGFGRLAPYVRHLADAGLLGIAGAEGPPFVAPHGGARPVIGTNPFALALGRGDARVVVDAASSTATMADIRNARDSGTPLPEGIALDGEGRPTTVAAEVAALLPRGGQVGTLLGLVVELMAGVAGGGRGDPRARGVFIIALDPARSDERIDWQARLAALQADWIEGGGHWPQGGSVSPEAVLDSASAKRLHTYLARMTGEARQ
ncbi:Ldh family oxidoreductase [Chelativorans sp.]|uniref:Ldh family oxidoreductase n=1 Tax=Chelativorans sp. TaxID=2203393 RepID=UPI002810AA44|nr:Ldh family oxidoreductase [Chelativorans sp.]